MLALMQLIASGVACLVLAVIGAIVAANGFVYYGAIIAALGAAAFPWLLQEFIRRAFYTRSHARKAAFNDFVSYGLQLGGVVWLTSRGEPSPVAVLLVYGASSLVAVFLGITQLRGWLDFSGEHSLFTRFGRTVARVWNFGKWLVAQSMVNWFGMCRGASFRGAQSAAKCGHCLSAGAREPRSASRRASKVGALGTPYRDGTCVCSDADRARIHSGTGADFTAGLRDKVFGI
jgi:hypothetical protein